MKMMIRWLSIVSIVFALANCGSVQPTALSTTNDPSFVHTAWLTALDANNRANALALEGHSDPTMRERSVDSYLRFIQDYKSRSGEKPAWPGLFQAIDNRGVVAAGEAMIGRSVWQYSLDSLCFHTTMQQVDGQWRVLSFYKKLNTDCE
jgi:hypothetical protein